MVIVFTECIKINQSLSKYEEHSPPKLHSFMKYYFRFNDKTKNDWDMRDVFEKVPGKYDLLSMDYSKGEDTTDAAETAKKSLEQRKKVTSLL